MWVAPDFVISLEEVLVGAGEVCFGGSIGSTLAESLVGACMIMGWEKRVIEIAQKGQPLHFLSSHSLAGICRDHGAGWVWWARGGQALQTWSCSLIARHGPWKYTASSQAQEVGLNGR